VVAHAWQLRNQESAVAWLRRVLRSVLSDHSRRAVARQPRPISLARKRQRLRH
jgi:hypothetical protein